MPVVAVVGAALGVVMTGLALLVVTVLLCLFWRRRRRKSRELAYGITGGASDVTTSQNEAYAVTDGACQSSGSGMRMKTNEAYADMSSAMNEDAYTYVTQRNVSHCTTAVLTATNAAYNAHTSTDEVYDYPNSPTAGNDITTSSNEAYGITQQVNAISIAHATDEVHDITTSSNEAYGITQQGNAISIAHATDEVDDITTSSNEAYGVTTDILVTSPNQAYEAVMYQNEDTEYI